jgi:hypothetical protein
LSLDNNLIVTPGYQDTMGWQRFGKGLEETWLWLGLEDFRGLVGADQSFLQEELIRPESDYVANC